MRKFALTLPALAVALTSCAIAPPQHTSANAASARPAAASVDVGVDWNWAVSGDSAVRPLQAFSLHGKTYLQMSPQQSMPALVVDGQPVPFGVSPPYLVIQGTPDRIDVVANGYRAIVAHIGHAAGPTPATASPSAGASSATRLQRVSMATPTARQAATAEPLSTSDVATERALPPLAAVSAPSPAPAPALVVQAAPVVASADGAQRVQRVHLTQRDVTAWQIDPRQRMLSTALDQWASRVGMHVQWRAPVDVPIRGHAQYRTIFLVALNDALDDASGGGYRFLMGFNGHTIIVTAVRNA